MQPDWHSYFLSTASLLGEQSRLRTRGGQSAETAAGRSAGKGHLDFAANDYLGLRSHPAVIAAAQVTLAEVGWGSGASPVLTGYTSHHARLERALSSLCHCDDALLFSSGYACNVGALSSLASNEMMFFSDQLNHASLIDGMRLGRAARHVYRHLDLEDLRQLLRAHRHQTPRGLIVTESVFSMDGDCADLRSLLVLAQEFECGLVVDEAHATGVYGENGGGYLEECGLSSKNTEHLLLKLGTLSKALGGIGGYAAGSSTAIEYLVNTSRSYLFSTAAPAAMAAAALAATELLPHLQADRQRLRNRSKDVRQSLQAMGWCVPAGDSPIVPIIVGSETETLRISHTLRQHNISVPAIRPPTVPQNTSRLRISLSVKHTDQQIAALLDALSLVHTNTR